MLTLDQIESDIARQRPLLRCEQSPEQQRIRGVLRELYAERLRLTGPQVDRRKTLELAVTQGRAHPIARRFMPDAGGVTLEFLGFCLKCGHKHHQRCDGWQFQRLAFDWRTKHDACWRENPANVGCLMERAEVPKGFDDRQLEAAGRAPFWLEKLTGNADIKIAYAADAAFAIGLASLASSGTFVAGREATSVSNTTNKYLDYDVSGFVSTGTTPTVGELRLCGIRPVDDTPTWPNVFDGTDSAETVTNTAMVAGLPILWSGTNSTTSDLAYPIVSALTLAQCWGFVPDNFTVFFTHSTVAALNATAGNHAVNYRGIYVTST